MIEMSHCNDEKRSDDDDIFCLFDLLLYIIMLRVNTYSAGIFGQYADLLYLYCNFVTIDINVNRFVNKYCF